MPSDAGLMESTIARINGRGKVLPVAGVRLVGIDTPGVDLYAAADLPVHRRLAEHGIASIEGLRLDHVLPGEYELIALPLRLVGCDASPLRAVLRPVAS